MATATNETHLPITVGFGMSDLIQLQPTTCQTEFRFRKTSYFVPLIFLLESFSGLHANGTMVADDRFAPTPVRIDLFVSLDLVGYGR